jgi:uncharacterized protein YjbI with pentapeptide repeats
MNTDRDHSAQQTKQSRWGFRGKTVWNWLELLIVPLALAVIGLWFTTQQETRQQIENQRAEAERELAVQRGQDEALQAYLDQMSTLMLEKDLRNSEDDSEVRTLARARTLTVLKRLDASRKEEIMNFLVEADLVREVGGSAPVIRLENADLRDADLSFADLRGANLAYADLEGADLASADLSEANLLFADLSKANLILADLSGAKLLVADLTDAGLFEADLRDANLSNALLTGADLEDADLRGANLAYAKLKDAEEWTEDQLSEAKNLKGATMPNGQKYEDWLKDR